MKDFNYFKNESANPEGNGGKAAGADYSDVSKQFAELSAAYEGKSADEIMKAILKEAEKGRKNGTLSDKDIDNFSDMISPMLNAEQRKTLGKVVKRLKNK